MAYCDDSDLKYNTSFPILRNQFHYYVISSATKRECNRRRKKLLKWIVPQLSTISNYNSAYFNPMGKGYDCQVTIWSSQYTSKLTSCLR